MISMPRRRSVADVMTTQVHFASPHTPFKLLVRLIEENRVSALPVVDEHGIPVGVVSESDLLLKERRTEFESERNPLQARLQRRARVKAEGLVARDVMSSPAITITTDTALADAARVMHERNVRRLVVIDDRGRIAGIVTRSDLLQVFLRSDEDLREDVVANVIPAILLDESRDVDVQVLSNVVTLKGLVDRKSDVEILARVTNAVDGVVGVVNKLTYRWDDTARSRFAAQLP